MSNTLRYVEEGRLEISENFSKKAKKKRERPVLKNGTIVYCRGSEGAGSFYGIVYSGGVLELPLGSDAYIKTRDYIHIGDRIGYWTIESVCKAKIIIEDIYEGE